MHQARRRLSIVVTLAAFQLEQTRVVLISFIQLSRLPKFVNSLRIYWLRAHTINDLVDPRVAVARTKVVTNLV